MTANPHKTSHEPHKAAHEPQKSAMVKVRLLCSRTVQSGSNFLCQSAGKIVEMSPDEAQRHIDGGLAELVELETVHE
jgi:hypothetical protein